MIEHHSYILSLTAWVCVATAVIGSVYTLIAAAAVRRFANSATRKATSHPAITILKPLHGFEPELYENLRSFCQQDYAGPVEIIFGVQGASDPAADVVRGLIADLPDADLVLVIDSRPHGANRKIANLINMSEHISNDVLVIADSDTRVLPDYLSRIIGALEEPGVGLATCLYRGAPESTLPARLAGMEIDYHFLPNVLAGLVLGLARPCFGSTIALHRQMLGRIGGFEAFSEHLADDHAMGEAVRRAGAKVAIPAMVVEHSCPRQKASELVNQELRWARTIRLINPTGFMGSLITHPFPLVLLAVLLGDFDYFAPLMVAAILLCRLALQREVDFAIGASPWARWHLAPLRDVISFLIFVSSFFVTTVSWRGYRYRVHLDGTLSPLRTPAQ
jgi:ceramide glucosyltransferase